MKFEGNDLERLARAEAGEASLVLVRHGRTAWNLERRFLGRTDVPLDARGRTEALAVGRRLACLPVGRVVSSPLQRAADTARAIAAAQDLPVDEEPQLVELAQGELEGLPGSALPDRFPDFLAQWLTDPATARVPGGETLAECQDRALQALLAIAAQAPDLRPVVVVSHQMVIVSVLCHVLGLPLRMHAQVNHKNAAFSLLRVRAGRLELVHMHETAHLDGLEEPPALSAG